MGNPVVLKLENIKKAFPGVKAVDNVSIEFEKGEIHALLGHNGAGKSTLVKIISGAYTKDEGKIYLDSQEVNFTSPLDAISHGIAMVYQELDLIPDLDGSTNIFLGQKLFHNKLGFINHKKKLEAAKKYVVKLGVDIDLTVPVRKLSVSMQQLIAIAKVISRDTKIIIFDEPTSALNDAEIKKLFEIMKLLAKQGLALIFITHRLDEVFEIANKVTIMRDGKKLYTRPIEQVTMEQIISEMTGTEMGDQSSRIFECHSNSKVVLKCENLTSEKVFKNISFDLHQGEVLGLTGLIGCGATEIAKAIYGAYRVDSGTISINGRKLKLMNPCFSAQNGIAYISEDRKKEGLVLISPVKNNISITILKMISNFGFINFKKEVELVQSMVEKLEIRIANQMQLAGTLSGGNQQKVVLSKWLLKDVNTFIMCEPTRGIDVGTKKEIHKIIRDLAASGISLLVVSSEIEEILDTCDRILVLYEGEIRAEINQGEAQKSKIINLMYGVD